VKRFLRSNLQNKSSCRAPLPQSEELPKAVQRAFGGALLRLHEVFGGGPEATPFWGIAQKP
jgi:hypothetical protein